MKLYIPCFLLLSTVCGFAEGTQTWEQSKFEEFEKGTTHGVAIRSEGDLELAPQFKALYTSPSTYLWAITTDGAGNVYVAAGSPARVYRVTPDGKSQVIFEPKELQVQALAEHNGVLYAATSPDGKVYKIQLTPAAEQKEVKPKESRQKETQKETKKNAPVAGKESEASEKASSENGNAQVFFDPQTKYIWDLAVDKSGQLYVATGDNGQIFRVSPAGEGSVFFKSDEAHIRVLAFDRQGNLLAGSDGSGLIYRISPSGEAFVLYSASKKEITALAVDEDNNIYAAGIGEKRAPAPAPLPGAAPPSNPASATSGTIIITPGASPPSSTASSVLGTASSAGGSEVYKIAADGSPTQLWNSRDELVYALAFERIAAKQYLVAGTGNKGRIFAIRSTGEYTDLVKASANQVTAITNGTDGVLYAATSNLGKVFVLGPSLEAEGSYESDVFDAHLFSQWGRMEARGQGNFELQARSGNVDNPDRNWSPWEKVNFSSPEGPVVKAPSARFLQWKAVLHSGQKNPRIESVVLNYRSKNAAPVIDDVIVQVGARFPPSIKSSGDNTPIILGGENNQQPSKQHSESFATAMRDKDSIAVRWSAHDDNNDDLVYSLYYRGDGETQWKPLTREKLTDKFYSFDTDLLPDGGYTIKVVASDAPSHSPEDALTSEKEGSRFEVDNTPPRIEDLNAAFSPDNGGEIHVTFRASDSFSPIRRAEYSFDAGDWQFVEPVGKLSDSKTENYDFNIPLPAASAGTEHVVIVRTYDQYDNVGSSKSVIRK
ncbi:MAG TPA: hypothetical protein VFA71_00110 [Terriglobales bacterium]|nr:hypothetical protein [Terriglobales bacterium]